MPSESPLVSICLPHWQLKTMATLCLRSIRKHSADVPHEIIVVDNGSRDDSLTYLRSLPWIRLVERGDDTPANAATAHQSALDLALTMARGRYFLATHCDVVVKRDGWLQRLMQPLEHDAGCGAVGSDKMKLHSPLNVWCRRAFDTKRMRLWFRRAVLRDASATFRNAPKHPRDFCAMYRTPQLRNLGVSFVSKTNHSAGETAHRWLVEQGFRSEMIPVREMQTYIDHVEHGTPASHPDSRGIVKKRTQTRAQRRLRHLLAQPYVRELAAATELDQ